MNLARLTSRAGDPEGAYHTFDAINSAVHNGGRAMIHGTTISFDGFTATDSDRSKVSPWLRMVLRDDGTRALAAAGNWARAAAHAEQYDDAGEQLREARQTRIIAAMLDGHTDSALTLIDSSTMTRPWDHAVATCLRSYAHITVKRLNTDHLAAMLTVVRLARELSDRGTTLFRTRLGLIAVDLSAELHQEKADLMCDELIDEAQRSTDAFVACEVLSDPLCRMRMTLDQAVALTALIERAGLGAGSIPEPILGDLMASVQTAGAVLADTLSVTNSVSD